MIGRLTMETRIRTRPYRGVPDAGDGR
jgi:hypothetical protein